MNCSSRSERFQSLLVLARTMHRWTKAQLAEALGRDPSKLLAGSGNPKLDLVVSLAEALGWTLGEVVDFLDGGDGGEGGDAAVHSNRGAPTFNELDAASIVAMRRRDWREVGGLARQMRRIARNGDERAIARHREAVSWQGHGYFTRVASAAQLGLGEPGLGAATRLLLATDLAGARYALWDLREAIAMADTIADHYRGRRVGDRIGREILAASRAIRGHAHRRLATREREAVAAEHALRAAEELSAAEREYRWLHEDFGEASDLAHAHTCRGGRLEAEAMLAGSVESMVDEVVESLDCVVDPAVADDLDQLESHGWWCVFAGNLALRHLPEDRLQQPMAILTNKALEIAEAVDSWPLRERGFTLEHLRIEAEPEARAARRPWLLDWEEIRLVTGAIGRFPSFRAIGRAILRRCIAVGSPDDPRLLPMAV
jgi:transcriptional regulator with XRE-family HTH domain